MLDLDETLVHSTLDGSVSTSFSFEVFFNNRTHSVSVRQRPHLSAFLQRCADLFEVVIFTASQKLYAEQLLNMLDPQRSLPPTECMRLFTPVNRFSQDTFACRAQGGAGHFSVARHADWTAR